MTSEEKLKEIEEYVNNLHTQCGDLIEDLDNKIDIENYLPDEEEYMDYHGWNAIVNITSQIKEILNK